MAVEGHEGYASVELSEGLLGSVDPGTYHRSYVLFLRCEIEGGSQCSKTFPEHDGGRWSAGTLRRRRGEVIRVEVLGLKGAF
jgi:hypothetical protein